MKVLIIANRQRWKSWDSKIAQVVEWFKPAFNIEFTVEHVKLSGIPFESYGIFDGKERSGVSKSWYQENIVSKYPGYDRYILSMNRKDWKGFPVEGWQWNGSSIAVTSDEKGEYNFKGVQYPGGKWFNLARHELCHAEYDSRGIPDRTHYHWDSGDLSNVLLDFIKPTMPTQTYKYFKESEIKGLSPALVEMLDKARGLAGIPFVITSGLRTEERNETVGGVKDSAHLKGLAVDLLVKDSVAGGKILLGLVGAGFKRFGFYEDGHIHVDIDDTKPSPCYWQKFI